MQYRSHRDALPQVVAFLQQHNLSECVKVCGVPRHRPDTREQWEAWSQHWPLTWKPPARAPGTARHAGALEPIGSCLL